MKCDRCGSVMVYEKFFGPEEHFSGWRCLLCGEILDEVILENRRVGRGHRQKWERRSEGNA